ncbi:DUF6660 family protein [Gilvibacter sp.]|jgi:hypothetical protein|uniref:DUF6660 family protein n=1 Tax=Gilvibacter sp. TaxID=2729997 RepID=UPI003B5189A7
MPCFCNFVAFLMFYICIVKVFTIILSIYFLALNVVPCSDTGDMDSDSQTVSVIEFDGDHDDDCELCSPFCNCLCCHVHTVDFGFAELEFPPIPMVGKIFTPRDKFNIEFSPSVFQPPRCIG